MYLRFSINNRNAMNNIDYICWRSWCNECFLFRRSLVSSIIRKHNSSFLRRKWICLSSLFHSFLSSFYLLNGDINIPVISPQCPRSDIFPSSIFPSFMRNISNSSTFVVFGNLHHLSVFFVAHSFIFQNC
jgi:hypothetical protein